MTISRRNSLPTGWKDSEINLHGIAWGDRDAEEYAENKGLHDYSEKESRYQDVLLEAFHDSFNEDTLQADSLFASLPNLEVFSTSQYRARRRRKRFMIISGSIIAVVAVLLIGIVIGRNTSPVAIAPSESVLESSQVDSASGQDDAANSDSATTTGSRFDQVAEFIIQMQWSEMSDIETPGTPQWTAAMWIADHDTANPPFPLVDSVALRERFAVAVFYFAMGGEDWHYNVQFLSANGVCTWNGFYADVTRNKNSQVGVTCNEAGSVEKLIMPNNNMKGRVPNELRLLKDLAELDIPFAALQGSFPSVVQSLTKLKALHLDSTQLTGVLPNWIGSLSNLEYLDLSQNDLGGPLPESLGRLRSLLYLDLEHNSFSGSLGALQGSNAQYILLGDNEFQGPFDDRIMKSWKNIQILDASENAFTGSLPECLLEHETLEVIDLHGNSFHGELPSRYNPEMKLKVLALHENGLTGPIDERIWQIRSLELLDISDNKFTGSIPEELGSLSNLKYLYLAHCSDLSAGPIPSSLQNLQNIVELSLLMTKRKGQIPTFLGLLSNLNVLDLSDNSLSGEIPPEFGNLMHLQHLLLTGNELSGSLLISMANIPNLTTLMVDHNELTGSAEDLCVTKPNWTQFVADCAQGESFSCSCCTKCCRTTDTTCNGNLWVDNVYRHERYTFNDDDYDFIAGHQ